MEDRIQNILSAIGVEKPAETQESSLTNETVEDTTPQQRAEQSQTEANPTPTAVESDPAEPTTPTTDFTEYQNKIAELETKLQEKGTLNKTGNPILDRLLELQEQGSVPQTGEDLVQLFRPLDKFDTSDLDVCESLLVEKMMAETGFSKKEVQEELELRFPELYDENSDVESKEYKSAVRRYKLEADKFLSDLKDKQSKFTFPKAENQPMSQEQIQSQFKQWEEQSYQTRVQLRTQLADQVLKGRESVKISVGDVEVDYQPSKEVLNKIKNDIQHIENIGSAFVNKDQTVNEALLFEFLLYKNDRENYLKTYGDVRESRGKKQFVETNLKNATNPAQTPKQAAGTPFAEGHPLHDKFNAVVNAKK